MATVSLAVAASHAPGIAGWFDRADETMQGNVSRAYGELGEHIRAAELDVLVVLANDHLLNFPVTAYPDYAFGLASVHTGPDEWFRPWLRLSEYRMAGAPEIGAELFRGMLRGGMRATAVEGPLRFDDNLSVPVGMCDLATIGVPILPIVHNCTVPPIPDERATYRWGRRLGEVIDEALDDDLRVGLFGSGGMSHEPGGAGYLKIDEEFDRRFLELLQAGNHEQVLTEATFDAMEAAGSGGTAELLSWIAVMGAIGERACEVLCYEPVVEWRCGIGAVQWDV